LDERLWPVKARMATLQRDVHHAGESSLATGLQQIAEPLGICYYSSTSLGCGPGITKSIKSHANIAVVRRPPVQVQSERITSLFLSYVDNCLLF